MRYSVIFANEEKKTLTDAALFLEFVTPLLERREEQRTRRAVVEGCEVVRLAVRASFVRQRKDGEVAPPDPVFVDLARRAAPQPN